jgi:hypothetical protein
VETLISESKRWSAIVTREPQLTKEYCILVAEMQPSKTPFGTAKSFEQYPKT